MHAERNVKQVVRWCLYIVLGFPLLNSCKDDYIYAVSYTHLDVYKRQGIDMDVYDWAYQTLEDQVNKGILDEAYVDRACRRVLAAKFRLGVFDDPYGDPDKVDKVVRSKAHVALAKKVADESIVLLENKNDILPLDLKKYKSIAVLGPNSNYGVAGDYGWVEFDNRECVTLFDGLKQAVGKEDVYKRQDIR